MSKTPWKEIPYAKNRHPGSSPNAYYFHFGFARRARNYHHVVCNTIPIVAEEFFATELTLKAGEVEVDGAVAATSQGKAGDSGMRFTLPWQGRTLLQFAAPNGYKEAKGGIQVPNSLDIYLSAVA